jgi:CBS domain-containing protein
MIRAAMRPITAADLMNPKVLAVRDDLTLRELAAFLIRNQITGAPVEDGAGRIVGVVSLVDIAEAVLGADTSEISETSETSEDGLTAEDTEDRDDFDLGAIADDDLVVRDIMTPAVDAVPEDATVSEVASRMLDSQVHRLLVTREGRPVGIVTTSDLLGLLIDE